MTHITLISAMDRNRGIGRENKMPWRIPYEMQHFRKTTLNHIVIMGGNTFRSFHNRTLPQRINIIISKTLQDSSDYVLVRSPEEAIEVAKEISKGTGQEIFVIGGATIYKALMEHYTRTIISEVDGNYSCDRYLPEIKGKWELVDHWAYVNYKTFDSFKVYTHIKVK